MPSRTPPDPPASLRVPSRSGRPSRPLIQAALLAGAALLLLAGLLAAPQWLVGLAAAALLVLLASLLLLAAHVARPKRESPGGRLLAAERMFEQLYRIARQAEAQPQQVPAMFVQLLCDLYEPAEAGLVGEAPTAARVADEGSTLLVPLPALADPQDSRGGAVRLRFARRGGRLFSAEDVRLTERIGEQLRRAVAFDRAVEQGRNEERLRLAQDLHDDIGARLLTLMYKAHSPEIEEYVRHTLKDLKTLTRGLAAPSHRFSHAAAEWKADLAQRLTAADIALGWTLTLDRDRMLNVVQWSALTRILRELVSNVIAHAGARRVDVALLLGDDHLELSVTDDGIGRDPGGWSHGLGLGGVRKRVRQLAGDVEWIEAKPAGIGCRVRVLLLHVPE